MNRKLIALNSLIEVSSVASMGVAERELTLPAGLVVLATGMLPDASLYRACVAARVASETHVIGDAFEAGRVFEAVKAGYAVGTAL